MNDEQNIAQGGDPIAGPPQGETIPESALEAPRQAAAQDASVTTARVTGDIVHDGPVTRVENLKVDVAQPDGPEGGDEPLVDQPEPDAPLREVDVQEEANAADAIIVLKNEGLGADAGLSMGVRINTAQPDIRNNRAQFFGHWMNENLPWLLKLAMGEFDLRAALRKSEDRSKLRLLSQDGRTPLEP